jgi:protein SCO1/2
VNAPGDAVASAPAPVALRVLRWGLWALLLVVLTGLVAVWLWGPGGRALARAERLPAYGELPEFSLVERSGTPVDRAALAGRPWVAGLVFTRCRASCPLLMERLRGLDLPAQVRRVAISVDPTYDTVPVLATYARQHGLDQDPSWWLLTGGEDEIRRLAIEGFKLGVASTPADDPRAAAEPITHSTRLVLVDGDGAIRGYYDAFDPAATAELERDAEALAITGGEPGTGGGRAATS